MKKCSKCGQVKDLNEFCRDRSRKDGKSHYCKACHSARDKAYRAANREKDIARHRAWRAANPEKSREISKAWRDANPERRAAYEKAYRAANREKRQAQYTVSNAVRDGKMEPSSSHRCADCDQPAQDYHHEDYTQPMHVVALCRSCHKQRHADQL